MANKSKSRPMQNITINLPELYDKNIQKLIKDKVVPSRSECIRIALREFFKNEFENLQLLGFLNKISGYPVVDSIIGPEMESTIKTKQEKKRKCQQQQKN